MCQGKIICKQCGGAAGRQQRRPARTSKKPPFEAKSGLARSEFLSWYTTVEDVRIFYETSRDTESDLNQDN